MRNSLRAPLILVCLVLLVSLACNALNPAPPTPNVPPGTAIQVMENTPTPLVPTTQPSATITPLASNTPPPATTTSIPPTSTSVPSSPTIPAASPTPPPLSTGPYAVILVNQGDSLNIRKTAGATQPLVEKLAYNATGITPTGKEKFLEDGRWIEVKTSSGKTGWVNANYLTEYVPVDEFCSDQNVVKLIESLKNALLNKDGKLLSSLISPVHGWSLQYLNGGNIANYTPEEARWVFESTYVMNWGSHPASGQTVKGSFHEEVLPKLQDVFKNQFERKCNHVELGGNNYEAKWPAGYANIHYYSLYKPGPAGNELDWRTLLVGVEYVEGKPTLFSLLHFTWEP